MSTAPEEPLVSEQLKTESVKEKKPVERATLRSYLCGCIPGHPHPRVSAKKPSTDTTKEAPVKPPAPEESPEAHPTAASATTHPVAAPTTTHPVEEETAAHAKDHTAVEKLVDDIEAKKTAVHKEQVPFWKRFLPGSKPAASTSSEATAAKPEEPTTTTT